MTGSSDFWDGIAERYAARPLDNPDAYEATLDRVRHWLTRDMSVLEIGSGTGTTALRLADAAGSILGTDGSAQMVRIAQDKAGDAAGISFAQADARTAGGDALFDAVLAFNLLHLLPDRAAVLAHVRSRLPEGGLFLSKTPCLGGKPWFRPLIFIMRCVGKAPPGIAYLRPEALQTEIAAAGFEIVETGDYPKSLPNHFIVARAV